MKTLLLITLSLAITVSMGYGAKHEGQEMMCCPHEGWEMGHALMMLELSEEQMQEIEKMKMAAEKNIISVKADIDIKKLDLEKEMTAESPNRDEVMKLVKDIHALELKIKQTRIDQHLQMHALLTPEQRAQMKGPMHKCMRMDMMEGEGQRRIMIMKEHCGGCKGKSEVDVKCEQHKME
ncbi:MAG: periplasmic heavy metal sensor [bacterium]